MEVVSFKPFFWLLGLVPLLIALRYSLVDRPRQYKFVAVALRIAAIVLLILAVCRPFSGSKCNDLHIAFILDVSESVALGSARDAVDTIQTGIDQLDPSDSWSLFMVADEIRYLEDTKQAAAQLDAWLQSTPDNSFRSASKLADALLTARLCFPANKAKRTVLCTDGRPTHTDVKDALTLLEKERIDLRMHELSGLRRAEACIESIKPSTTKAFEGEVVRMTTKIRANQSMSARLRILSRGISADTSPACLA